jgi:superfamily I DNA and/or RNA helicase
VLVSMTTSTAESISRGMDFLYNRNRLNIAVSLTKRLVVIASPSCSSRAVYDRAAQAGEYDVFCDGARGQERVRRYNFKELIRGLV